MILQLILFNLADDTTPDDFLAFDRRVVDQYASYLAQAKRRYLGVFEVQESDSFRYAELTVIDTATLDAARAYRRALLPDPPEMEAIFEECETYMSEAAVIGFEILAPSPNVTRSFRLDRSLIRFALAQLNANHTLAELADFERRSTGLYSAHMGQIDWYYTGVYQVDDLPGYDFAEIDVVESDSVAAIKARSAELPVPPDIESIDAEGWPFIGAHRMTFWLKPLQIAPTIASGLRLSEDEMLARR